jgi:RNA polymerase sigma-70 factor (ECF subfamily)
MDVTESAQQPSEFAAFYAVAIDPAYRAVLLATRHQARAEDAVHEAFARAYERWDEIRSHPAPMAWVIRVALNVHRSSWRIWRRETSEPIAIAVADDLPIDAMLLRAVWRLPRRQRQVVALRVLLDLSAAQTAETLGMSAGAVGSHLHRALAALRASLVATGYQETQT